MADTDTGEKRPENLTPWGAYVWDATHRPGWTIARLARESDVHRSVFYKWINGEIVVPDTDTVRKVGIAADGKPDFAIQAAAGLIGQDDDPDSEAIALILAADIPDSMKQELIADLRRESRRDAARRREGVERVLRWRPA